MSDCCKKCKYLSELWYWNNNKKKYGYCCTMLAKTKGSKEVYVQINNPDSDLCEMFTENKKSEVEDGRN